MLRRLLRRLVHLTGLLLGLSSLQLRCWLGFGLREARYLQAHSVGSCFCDGVLLLPGLQLLSPLGACHPDGVGALRCRPAVPLLSAALWVRLVFENLPLLLPLFRPVLHCLDPLGTAPGFLPDALLGS